MKNPWDVLRGQELPIVVFWVYCMAGMAIATMFLGMFVMTRARDVSDSVIYLAISLCIAYAAWAHTSLWTCAFNAKRHTWAYVARIYAGVVVAGIAVTLVRSGVLLLQ
jgi:hypothetical protein